MPRNRTGRNGGHGFSLDGGTGRPAAKPPRNRLPRGRGAASHGWALSCTLAAEPACGRRLPRSLWVRAAQPRCSGSSGLGSREIANAVLSQQACAKWSRGKSNQFALLESVTHVTQETQTRVFTAMPLLVSAENQKRP